MKLRKQIRLLCNNLRDEVHDKVYETHEHSKFVVPGSGCILCSLINSHYSFAALQLVRQKGEHKEWLNSEKELFDLIGEAAFKNKVNKEVRLVKNMFKKVCLSCNGIVTAFIPIKSLVRWFLMHEMSDHIIPCDTCGNNVVFKQSEMPVKLTKILTKRYESAKKRAALRKAQSSKITKSLS